MMLNFVYSTFLFFSCEKTIDFFLVISLNNVQQHCIRQHWMTLSQFDVGLALDTRPVKSFHDLKQLFSVLIITISIMQALPMVKEVARAMKTVIQNICTKIVILLITKLKFAECIAI